MTIAIVATTVAFFQVAQPLHDFESIVDIMQVAHQTDLQTKQNKNYTKNVSDGTLLFK